MKALDQVELNLDDPALFEAAARSLHAFKDKPLTGNFAVAIAALLHRPEAGRSRSISRPGGTTTSTADLQGICDDTWRKRSEFLPSGSEGSIYKPFTMSFKPETNNNWRNSFDLQAGLGCDAPPTIEYLGSPDFVEEARYYCQFRDPSTAICHSPSARYSETPCFVPAKNSAVAPPSPHNSRAALRPKLIGRSKESGYWLIEQTAESLAGLLNSVGARIPVLPFAVSLYSGSAYLGRTGEAGGLTTALQADLGLQDDAFLALFDLDEGSPANLTIATWSGGSVASPAGPVAARKPITPAPPDTGIPATSSSDLPRPRPFDPLDPALVRVAAGRTSDPAQRADLLERASQGHQQTLNALNEVLSSAGYECASQWGGFDLSARHPSFGVHLFEVKTWTDFNLAKQTRSGWAQLYEYRHRNLAELGSGAVCLYLVFDREVPLNFWAWSWLAGEMGVLPCWITADGELKTLAHFQGMMPPGLP